MVGDLEQVPSPALIVDALEDIEVMVILEVAGEEDALAPDTDGQHDRRAVDGSAIA